MIFELQSRTNYHSISLPIELPRLFFTGEPVADKWQAPPAAFADAVSRRRVGDFPSGGRIPVFSQRAAEKLGSILRPRGELLPFECSGVPLYAFNVTCIADILDEQRSELNRYSNGRIGWITRHAFEASRIPQDLLIFRLPPEQSSRVYATGAFARCVEAAGLQGFRFEQLWPDVPRLQLGPSRPKTLDDLMRRDAQGELEDDFDTELWHLLCDRIPDVTSLQRWPEPVRVYYASRLLEWEVGNGGFAQAAMNIPEWFEEAAKAYAALGKPNCAQLIRSAAIFMQQETDNIDRARGTLEQAFEYFQEGVFEEFDGQLDAVDWWSEWDRVDYVRAHRAAFTDGARAA